MSQRVLVADDSSTTRKIVVRSLQSLGLSDVIEAADGDQALARFEPGAFQLVLADWRMPGVSGLALLNKLRSQDAEVPILLLSTEGEREHVFEAIEGGATDYLFKPFTADMLREKIEKLGCGMMA